MKEILITNDDGFESKGLKKLLKMLKSKFKARITVVAPASEKSGSSHSITLTRPLRLVKIKENFYKLDDGTPTDCVYLALHALYKHRLPDLVISGINHGANISEDISYSGTCAGAMEAVLQGVPALALSQYFQKGELQEDLSFKNALKITYEVVNKILTGGFPLEKKEFINLNFPSARAKFKGLRVARAGKRVYNYKAYEHKNPRGFQYFWLASTGLEHESKQDTDIDLLLKGYAVMTPVMLDLTAYKRLETLKKWASFDLT
ncbi:5'/3'-nucleotidase SurE [Campylobacter troglodytis]|uniref:5'/3'-nucleotidase SurE n=1 Tax=Campylobacter troglodytis TaxID=654363 RepID=UPI00115AF414|nr:5'/3'-nucleotidase SurE [Campylobacter troglodytis]TQR53219.1 5'/3'-nucleotidase SurE [Campylobacter troglodytis]